MGDERGRGEKKRGIFSSTFFLGGEHERKREREREREREDKGFLSLLSALTLVRTHRLPVARQIWSTIYERGINPPWWATAAAAAATAAAASTTSSEIRILQNRWTAAILFSSSHLNLTPLIIHGFLFSTFSPQNRSVSQKRNSITFYMYIFSKRFLNVESMIFNKKMVLYIFA